MSAKEEFAAMKKKKAEDAEAAEAEEEERKKGVSGGGKRTMLARSNSMADANGQRRKSAKEKKDFEQRMSSIETKWYKHAALIQDWDPKKKDLFIALKRFVTIIYVAETRKRLDGMPVYKEWVDKMDKLQKEANKKRSNTMKRFAVGDAVAGAVSELSNEMLHGVSAETPPQKRMELVMTNAKGRGLSLPQIFGFFLGRTLEEALKIEMTEELEEELYRTELSKELFGDALQRLDKYLFDVSDEELDDLISDFDEDGSGTISLTEFRDWCFRIPSLTWKTARKAFEEEQITLLKTVPLLAELKLGALRRLLGAMTTEFYNQGDHVMKQGDTEDRSLFIIIGGTADATRDEQDAAGKKTGEKVVGKLPSGAFFGESALINEEPRSANIVATSKLKCVKLDQKMYERILGDIQEQVKAHSEARQGTNIVSDLIEIYSGGWKPKLRGSERFEVKIVLSEALMDEGAVIVLAYNKARNEASPPLFIDAGGARSLTSAMEMREAQKVASNSMRATAAKNGGKIERGARGLTGIKTPVTSSTKASSGGGLSSIKKVPATVKTLEMHKSVENECMAKALLMRFLPSPEGILWCRLLRGDSEDTLFCVEENPGIPQDYLNGELTKMGEDGPE